MKRLISHIPNAITSLNLLCGVLGVIALFSFEAPDAFKYAFILMLLAAVADFFDGFSARLLGAYSDIGKELDSLSDLVSFGVLPSLMLYKAAGPSIPGFSALFIAVFSALRLAKFNLDDRQSSSFLGLPTPACAMLCAGAAYSFALYPAIPEGKLAILLLSVCACVLLVSEIPMFSLKVAKGKPIPHRKVLQLSVFFSLIAIEAILCLVLRAPLPLLVFAIFFSYIVENLVFLLVPKGI